MHLQTHLRSRKIIRALAQASAAVVISAALLAPASAQFWNPFNFGGPPRQQQRAPQQQQQFNPFGNFFGPGPEQRRHTVRRPDAPPQEQAPSAPRRSAESAAAITSPILVLGDSMADWLAYGLEDAFAEKPEFGIVRKHRMYSGLVRYDPRRDVEWPQIVREAIAADKPKFIVMMVGFHDRQPIRERGPATPSRGPSQTSPQNDPEYQDAGSPETRARASAAAQNAEMERAKQAAPAATPEQKRAPAAPSGPVEFQSEAWQAAYVQRIDATIAALKSANVPVFWVGLPPQRVARQSADAVYLNELFRTRAERAGIIYVDIWDGFVDEAGRYVLQGPDFEGQTRRLRSGDGLYFTRAGARKLAHYVEREILRSLVARETPVALPAPEPAVQQPGRPGTTRPLAGPVVPLTASIGGGNELLGGGPTRPAGGDPLATRVLVRGEPVTAPAGRADNFAWPRSGAATIREDDPDRCRRRWHRSSRHNLRRRAPRGHRPRLLPPSSSRLRPRPLRRAPRASSSSNNSSPARPNSRRRRAAHRRCRRARATIPCRGRHCRSRASWSRQAGHCLAVDRLGFWRARQKRHYDQHGRQRRYDAAPAFRSAHYLDFDSEKAAAFCRSTYRSAIR